MLKLVKNCVLLFGILAIILIFGIAIYFNEIFRNVSLGISAVMGALLALWRISILNEQTKIENGKLSLETEQTKIENGKLLLETEQVKFDMQAKTLAKIWSYVIDLNVNNAKVLSLYQNPIDLSQYSDAFLKGYFKKKGLSEEHAQAILKGPKDRIKENFLMSIFPKKIIAISNYYDDFCTTYAKNKILLFPEIAKQLDKFKDEINKIMLVNHEILMKQIQYNEDRLKKQNTTLLNEDAKKLEKIIKEIEKICNKTEKIIQDFLFLHISNSKNK